MSQTRIDYDPALSAFLRPHAERSAAPVPDREPEKRGLPPSPPVEPAKVDRVDSRAFPPAAVETFVRSETFTSEIRGIISAKCLIGKSADGRTPPGALPWHWCYGRQPVHVPGAVYADSDEGRHLVKGITEAEAERRILAGVGLTLPMTPRLAREKARRR